jgi:hypothetical protein
MILIGQEFNRLQVMRDDGTRVPKRIHWICRCVCGHETRAFTNDLISGHKKSCGCLHDEVRGKILRRIGKEERVRRLHVRWHVNRLVKVSVCKWCDGSLPVNSA